MKTTKTTTPPPSTWGWPQPRPRRGPSGLTGWPLSALIAAAIAAVVIGAGVHSGATRPLDPDGRAAWDKAHHVSLKIQAPDRVQLASAVLPAAASAAYVSRGTSAGEAGGVTSAGRCYGKLTYGMAVIERTTGWVGDGYLTTIRLSTTGDGFRLVTNRGYGWGTKGNLVRLKRGITGDVAAARSWSFHSRTGNITASVAGVDANNGLVHFRTSC